MRNLWLKAAGVCWLLGGLFFGGAAVAGEAAAGSLRVNLAKIIQPDFLGVNAVYHGFAFMPEQKARGMTAADRAREFKRIEAMRLNVARTWYRADWAVGESMANEFNWRSEKMNAFCEWLAVMQKLNVDIALQAGWWMKDTHIGYPGQNVERDKERYAEWVSGSLQYLIKERGFTNIKYLILFTEPQTSGGHSWKGYVAFVRAIQERLKKDGLRDLVKTVAPNNSRDGKHLEDAIKEINDIVDIYSGHQYHHQGYAAWLAPCAKNEAIVKPTGKPYWVDEYNSRLRKQPYGITAPFGNDIAQIVTASMNAGNQASMLWLLFDQLYVAPIDTLTNGDSFTNGVHRWGLCKWPGDKIAQPTYPYPTWYAFSMLSRHLGGRNGTAIYQTEAAGGIFGTATAPGGKELSVMVVNPTTAAVPVDIKLSKAVNRPLRRYLFDPAKIVVEQAGKMIPADKTIKNAGSGFSDTIPPKGIAIYTTEK